MSNPDHRALDFAEHAVGGERLVTVTGSDGRRLAGRWWRAEPEADVILVVHGVAGHSGWFHLWAAELATRGISLLAPDRRGSGLDGEARGDAESTRVLLEDLDHWVELAGEGGRRVHLCGFCWGSNYALHYLSRHRRQFASLLLLVPGIFPTLRVLARSRKTVDGGETVERGETVEGGEPTVEVPVRLEEFTRGRLLESYLRPDPLRLERVSSRFVAIEQQMAALLPLKLAKVKLPSFIVLAECDEVSDNQKTRELYEKHLGDRGRCVTLATAHGVVFEAPAELAEHCAAWIREL